MFNEDFGKIKFGSNQEFYFHYWSTIRGVTERETRHRTVYYGLLMRIPRSEFLQPARMEKERQFMQKLPHVVDDGDDVHEGWELMRDGVIERYEVFDAESDSVLILIRAPYQRSGDASRKHKGLPDHYRVDQIDMLSRALVYVNDPGEIEQALRELAHSAYAAGYDMGIKETRTRHS